MIWTENHIKQLQQQGKIKGYTISGKPGKKVQKKSKALLWLELNLPYWAKEKGLVLETEYRFCPERKYRSDWALPCKKILIEYEGGIFMPKGGHNNHRGIQRDIDKYALAQQLGYTVIRLTAKNYRMAPEQLNRLI